MLTLAKDGSSWINRFLRNQNTGSTPGLRVERREKRRLPGRCAASRCVPAEVTGRRNGEQGIPGSRLETAIGANDPGSKIRIMTN